MVKIEKEKHKVNIVCTDGSFVKGFVHIDPGLRLMDFLNNQEDAFVAVTNAEFSNVREVHSFTMVNEFRKKKDLIFLNKASIKLIEEIK